MRGRRARNALPALLVFTYVSFVAIPSAFAYIDPGTGSYIFQVLVGAALGAALAVKVFWRRIWGFLTGRSRARPAGED